MPKKQPVKKEKKEVSLPTRRYIVAGNWKMNPETLQEAKSLFSSVKDSSRLFRNIQLVVCPPFMYTGFLKQTYSGKKLLFGAQTAHTEESGSYTGETSFGMIQSSGAEYVILGHSERRKMGEADADIRSRIEQALSFGLTPIVCIGEGKRDNDGEYLSFLKQQLSNLFYGVSRDWMRKIVIAYEPIWAIGKGAKPVTAHQLHETAIYIRKILSEIFDTKIAREQTILYGGSVDSDNATSLIEGTQVDGFLVGRASLNAEDFITIARAVETYAKKS